MRTALDLARNAGVIINARVADLEGTYHITKDAHDVIICFNYLQRSLITQIKGGLRLGGIVAYETFTADQTRLGKPTNQNYLLKKMSFVNYFMTSSDFTIGREL